MQMHFLKNDQSCEKYTKAIKSFRSESSLGHVLILSAPRAKIKKGQREYPEKLMNVADGK